MTATNQRKHDHLRTIARDPAVERGKRYFDDLRLRYRALPELALADVDPSVEFLGKHLSFPLLISSMTGGSAKIFRTINRNLALAA
ncbi:MAG: type 2 isopentenyl-diphosphate Delta-isomerase, partial [Kiritimatiellaeota bacterium]|nr:type 2 isopentenyl-diphosphate Delta-isomerase [Kiritimatiellota bacterium]